MQLCFPPATSGCSGVSVRCRELASTIFQDNKMRKRGARSKVMDCGIKRDNEENEMSKVMGNESVGESPWGWRI